MLSSCLPTYGNPDDPFDPIRCFADAWNKNMLAMFSPGEIITVDESMALWKGMKMPGLMVVVRKPTPVGRENHTTADLETGVIIWVEIYEGKDRMREKEFVTEYGAGCATMLRCTKPWHGSGRLALGDSACASFKTATAMAERGMYFIGNVKTAHRRFPKKWLSSQCKERGQRAFASTEFHVGGDKWRCWASIDMDKQPMSLISTAATNLEGPARERTVRSVHSSGEYSINKFTLEQDEQHSIYRAGFNALDKHNAKRQGGTSFETTWKTWKWWVRDYQFFFGVSEVNAFLLWRVHKNPKCTMVEFRRRLTFQMLRNPWLLARQARKMRAKRKAEGEVTDDEDAT